MPYEKVLYFNLLTNQNTIAQHKSDRYTTNKQFPIQQAPEYRYHDHNNLSTKNKSNATERKKTDLNKKNVYPERTVEVLQDMCSKVDEKMKFDCYWLPDANEKDCVKRGKLSK